MSSSRSPAKGGETGIDMLANSKVGSASGFMVVAGNIMALPHPHRSSSAASSRIAFTATSEHASQFKQVPHCYASMDRKPLTPYEPNAYRSRLAAEDAPVPLKNASTIEFNDPSMCHKRRFVTTHRNHYTPKTTDLRSNASILAAETRREHARQLM
eukprot:CAMPEP_0204572926 /NCGR_PEP_ID=MMETSP0661-20131031/39731_1 /ASSEMBLY_ACC=CAM_ASM_000606 /TAXON_ID=109239 /ORGANISM="Alexandrium margalefi, Strain AMGDE01CS-322" /LENGTH=155 /DNA_ID=CAMNT_0051581305 /DNA_START=98 /DNA_END=565 /DNA_ORIENTATION=-